MMRSVGNWPPRTTAILLGGVVLAACSTRATTTGNYVAPTGVTVALPRPTTVVVQDFTVDPDAVRVDQGIGGRLRRGMSGIADDDTRMRDAEAVRSEIAGGLAQAIRGMGMPVQSGAARFPPPAPYVEIRGSVTSIDEGNRTRRTVLGFGAGQSSVSAVAEALYVAVPDGAPRLLQTYQASSGSGHMPGLGMGAASAVAGHVAVAAAGGAMHLANAGGADVGAEAKRLGTRLAANIGLLFAQQGWIPRTAVPRAGQR